jgi:proline-specific peptidase
MNLPLPDLTLKIDVEDGFQVWSRSVGGGAAHERTPLLIVHGGPGVPHQYLQNLAALASPVQRVIFYDQLGCGFSDQPDEPERWHLSRFVNEVKMVRKALKLDEVILLGQSWGGMLSIEYALQQPTGLKGIILSNTSPSARLLADESENLLKALPARTLETITRHEAAGTTDQPEYMQAMGEFYGRHVVRVHPMPDFVQYSFDHMGQPYGVMWGPNEFTLNGNLQSWNRINDLHRIRCPVLLICGEHDECTPAIHELMHEKIAQSRLVVLSGCSHLSHVEKPELYMQHVQRFLDHFSSES